MILAETMITRTAGAIAKLKFRILCVGSAADSALVRVEPAALLLTDPVGFLSEVDGAFALLFGKAAENGCTEEKEEIQCGYDREKIDRKRIGNYSKQKIGRVDECDILYFDWKEEKQQHLHVRVQGGKREEHGQVKILRVDPDTGPTEKIDEKPIQNGDDPPDEKVNIKMRGTPILLQSVSDPVIKVKDEKGKNTGRGRVEHKSHKTPDLPAEDQCCIKTQIGKKRGVGDTDKPESYICDRKIPHQIRNPKMRMFIAKTVNEPHGVFHKADLLKEMVPILLLYLTFFCC